MLAGILMALRGLRGTKNSLISPRQTLKVRRILFKTNRFNCSKVGAHFINPCCFGEDLAAWLRDKLNSKCADAGSPGQED
jgi:hypothetical protein